MEVEAAVEVGVDEATEAGIETVTSSCVLGFSRTISFSTTFFFVKVGDHVLHQ